MLKVLLICTTPIAFNGISKVILNSVYNMDLQRITFDLITPKWSLNKNEKKGRFEKIYQISNRSKNPIRYIHTLKKLMVINKYDIVHVHGNSSTISLELFAAYKANISVRISHAHASLSKYKIIHRILSIPFKHLYTHALACSVDAGKWMYGKKNFEVLKNGIEIEKYRYSKEKREKYRKKLNIEQKFVIGNIGYFNESKNQSFLVKVFKKIIDVKKNAILLLVGEGSLKEKNKIYNLINELGLSEKVILLGERDDVENILQVMDVFVFPSKYEGFGLVAVEAQISGLKTICSKNVPKDVKITENIEFLSLDCEINCWVEKILAKSEKRKDMSFEVSQTDYNAKNISKELEVIYMNLFLESKANKNEK